MIVHSDSTIGSIVTFVVMLTAIGLFIACVAFLVVAEFTKAIRAFAACLAVISAFVLTTLVLGFVIPQKIVNIGDSYCEDIFCIGIDKVSAAPQGQDIVYTLDVHIFSDANRVKTSAKGVHLYLFDERDRRFPMLSNPSAVPFDVTLDPGQTVRTTLTFAAAADARHLYLYGDGGKPAPFWVKWYLGSVHNIFGKPPLIRVL